VPLEPDADDRTVVTPDPKFADDNKDDEVETGDRTLDKSSDDEQTRVDVTHAPEPTQELEVDDLSVEEGLAFPTMPFKSGRVPAALAGTTPSPMASARRQSRRTPVGAMPIVPPPQLTPTPIVTPLPAPADPWPEERPVSSSGSLRARLEAEDVSHLRVGRGRRRYLVIAGSATFLAGLVLIVFLVARTRTPAPTPGTIEIVSVPPGGRLTVDGRPAGETPATLQNVPPGKMVHLRVELDHYEAWQEDEQPGEGKLKVIAALKPIVGHLVVTSTPDGAGVFLDNAPFGLTPLDRGGMDPFVDGTIELRKTGYETKRLDLHWDGRREVRLDATLVRSE
jgi:hypothetical protein